MKLGVVEIDDPVLAPEEAVDVAEALNIDVAPAATPAAEE